MTNLINIYPNDNMSFNIDNLAEQNTQEFCKFDIVLEKEGDRIYEDSFELDIEPENNYWYFLEPDEDLENGEYVYTLTAKATKNLDDYKRGKVIANSQKIFKVENNKTQEQEESYSPIQIEEDDTDVILTGDGFKTVFSKALGGLVSLEYDGKEYLSSKPIISFWRPLTDTDLHLGLQYEYAKFLGATVGQQLIPEKYYFEENNGCFTLTFVYRYPLPGGQESAVIYTVNPNGSINVKSTYSGLATVNFLPTFAINFKLNKSLDAIKYYGYGPDENYIDTTEGLNLGVYETTVRKNFKKHERPQETGNRTGVRWADVYDPKTGKGIRFSANKDFFEFDALPYNDIEIEAAQTKEELPKFINTNVRIAANVSGIGNGDFIEDWAKIDGGEMLELDFTISPIKIESPKKAKDKKQKKSEKETVEKKEEKSQVEKELLKK